MTGLVLRHVPMLNPREINQEAWLLHLEEQHRAGDVAVVIFRALRYRMLDAYHPDARVSNFHFGRAVLVALGIIGVGVFLLRKPVIGRIALVVRG